jgi:starch phosphorylase
MPEALETWPVDLIGRLLPRHMEIIYDINHRFLEALRSRYPKNPELPDKVSIIAEGAVKMVRMAHLAIVGSHAVNGVAELHSRILKNELFKEFNQIFPDRFQNVTNGVTPRRWLCQANPSLTELITAIIGPDWICDLEQLEKLVVYADDPEFRATWMATKLENKRRLARYILRKSNACMNTSASFSTCCMSSPFTTASKPIRQHRQCRAPSCLPVKRHPPTTRPNSSSN